MDLRPDLIKHFYRQPQRDHWMGRESNPGWPKQYFHEVVDLITVQEISRMAGIQDRKKVAILGYASDEGARRNFGRQGASNGPVQIRAQLGRLPVHFQNTLVWDIGDIICHSGDMESSLCTLADLVDLLLNTSVFPIVLGGSHDLSYGHVGGIIKALGNGGQGKIGMLNFDAHFDLRRPKDKGNSGTPFHQLLYEHSSLLEYFVVGIQRHANTKELFKTAEEMGVDYALHADCIDSNLVENRILSFVEQNDFIYISIDMDGFSSAFAPGVSAPSPFGLHPDFVCRLLSSVLATRKVVAFDIAEMNPEYDLDGQTASLAARLVNFVIDEQDAMHTFT